MRNGGHVSAGSQIQLAATAGSSKQVRRWDVRMFAADAPTPSLTPRLAYGSQIGGADSDQRIEIPPQDVDCWLKVDASRRFDGVWEADQSQVTCDTPTLLELSFGVAASPTGDDESIALSFHFCGPRRS
jgi:hypothetical protein